MSANTKAEKIRKGRETIETMKQEIDEAIAPVMPDDHPVQDRVENNE